MEITAVVEEITSQGLRILVGEEEKEIIIKKNEIDNIDNFKVGDWLDIVIENKRIQSIEVNLKETEKVKKRIQEKINKLRERGKK